MCGGYSPWVRTSPLLSWRSHPCKDCRTSGPGPSCTLVCLWAMLGPTDHQLPTRCVDRSASSFGPLGLSRSLGHCLSSWGAGTCFSGVLLPCDPLSLVTFMRCLVRSVWSLRKAWVRCLTISRAPFWGWEVVVLDTGVSACFHKVLLPALAPLILPMKGDAPLSPLDRDQPGWGG